ncbi:hypothetical protein L0152_31185 [bacterium]|nr:hypothetical protein [bacterium]
MTYFPKEVWNELLKNITIADLVKALQKDGFIEDEHEGGERVYIKDRSSSDRLRVTVHWSRPDQKFQRRMLEGIIRDTEWSIEDLQRLSLIK